jgi:hypothetical protein
MNISITAEVYAGAVASPAAPGAEGIFTRKIAILNGGTPDE